jgi:acyl carrier protein
MDRETIRQQLREMLNDHMGVDFENLQESDDLRTGLGLDSVDMVTLLIEIQGRLRVNIPADEAMKLNTVGELLDHVQTKLHLRAA